METKIKKIKLGSREFFEKTFHAISIDDYQEKIDEIFKELKSKTDPIIKLSIKADTETLNGINFVDLRKKLNKYGKVFKIDKTRVQSKSTRITKINKEISYKEMVQLYVAHHKPENAEEIIKIAESLIDNEVYGEEK